MTAKKPFRVAVVQDAPAFLDLESSVERACDRIREAGANGARLALFPEGFLPGYPLWVWVVPAAETKLLRELYTELLDNAVTVPGPVVERLGEAARAAGVHVAIGVNERNDEASGGSLYNSLLLIGADGSLLGHHRKLVPTGGERLVHARGDGSSLVVHELDVGRVAGLICWENYMPLARFCLYALGAQIWLAPTWDRGTPWTATLQHIAKEGRVWVLGCASAMRRDDIPDRFAFKQRFPDGMEWVNPGLSAIVDPDGKFVVEPVAERQEILYAEIDPRSFVGPRSQLDVAGHYGRPDIFELVVRRRARPVVRMKPEVERGSAPSVTAEPSSPDGVAEEKGAPGREAAVPRHRGASHSGASE